MRRPKPSVNSGQTFLFVTKPVNHPERVAAGQSMWWSCSKATRAGDRILVYVTGSGIQYEWRAESDAEPHARWKYGCDVEYVRAFNPPITLAEMRRSIRSQEWTPPHQNLRGAKSLAVPPLVAQRIMNLVWEDPSLEPSEVSGSVRFEGAIRRILVNAYERDPEARRRCIEHYGAVCLACGMDFGLRYGASAKGFIHVHHTKPLSQCGAEYVPDPVKDLKPVCPNCHAVIHHREKVLTIAQIRKLLSKQRTRPAGR